MYLMKLERVDEERVGSRLKQMLDNWRGPDDGWNLTRSISMGGNQQHPIVGTTTWQAANC
jgi:hypothetical protein